MNRVYFDRTRRQVTGGEMRTGRRAGSRGFGCVRIGSEDWSRLQKGGYAIGQCSGGKR